MTSDPGAGGDEPLRSLFDEAHEAQPEVTATFQRFRERAGALMTSDGDVARDRANELYLACACEEGDSAALNRFERELMPAARAAIARTTTHEDAIDDAVQELRRRLFVGPAPRIAAYSGRGPLWKWLRVTAVRTAHDLRRARGGEPVGGDEMVEMLLREDVDPEFKLVRQRYEGVFREALHDALETLTAQERTLLRLRYVQNQGIDALAIPFQTHRATVARWLQTIRGKILAHVHTRLEAHIPRLSPSEAQSLWRAVRSQVHLSFSRLHQDEEPADGDDDAPP